MEQYYLICTYILAGVLGLCFGSFMNVLIYRLPRGMNIAKPASHCPTCGAPIHWYDNIPVLSYIFLRGKCRNCKTHISFRYTVVEICNCLLWIFSVTRFYKQGIVPVICSAVALSCLTVAFFSDLETMIVPDSMTIGTALAGLGLLIYGSLGKPTDASPLDRAIGAVAGLVFFGALYFGFLLVKKKEGLGFGDVKLAGAMGLLLGWKNLLLSLIFASLSACVAAIVRRIKARKTGEEEKEFPFAPYLTASAAICLFFGNAIVDFYLGLFI